MRHTPKQWLRDGNTVYALRDVIFAGKPAQENIFYCSVQGVHMPDDEKENIARLIAAAPGMLAALKTCRTVILAGAASGLNLFVENIFNYSKYGWTEWVEEHIDPIIRAAEVAE